MRVLTSVSPTSPPCCTNHWMAATRPLISWPAEVRKYFELCWASWAGMPEEAVMVDRARYFLGEFADYLEGEGVRLDSSPLQ